MSPLIKQFIPIVYLLICAKSISTQRVFSECDPGYHGTACIDIDECELYKPCDPLAKCINLIPGYQCESCPPGYTGRLSEGYTAKFITRDTELQTCISPMIACGTNICRKDSVCVTIQGAPTCTCKPGFSLRSNGSCLKCQAGFTSVGEICALDSDLDGFPDEKQDCKEHFCRADNCPFVYNVHQEDVDGDGIGDICDIDKDNDGIHNFRDNCEYISNQNQKDSDSDGYGDVCDNCPAASNRDQLDTDRDGIGNACDGDSDNDGVPDEIDNCPLVPNADQKDFDSDGVGDACDNCPQTANSNQLDTNRDLIGNDCDTDLDLDADGVQDNIDNCLALANPNQLDVDKDGIGDACDLDIDGDDVLNDQDNCPLVPNADQKDSDSNGVGDVCENDNDMDGVQNSLDNCPNNSKIHTTDFRSHSRVSFDSAHAIWRVQENGTEVRQSSPNAAVSALIGDDKFDGVDFEGLFFKEECYDDDFFGLIFSFHSNKKFYVAMWKRDRQSWDRVLAEPGLQIKLVNSINGPSVRLWKALWNTQTTADHVKLLWKDPRSIIYNTNIKYHWKLWHRPSIGLIRMRIYKGAEMIVDSGNIFDTTLKGGRLGLYVDSQEDTVWSNMKYTCNEKLPKDIYEELPTPLKARILVET